MRFVFGILIVFVALNSIQKIIHIPTQCGAVRTSIPQIELQTHKNEIRKREIRTNEIKMKMKIKEEYQ